MIRRTIKKKNIYTHNFHVSYDRQNYNVIGTHLQSVILDMLHYRNSRIENNFDTSSSVENLFLGYTLKTVGRTPVRGLNADCSYPFVDNVASDDRSQQTGQVSQTVGQAHQYAREPRRYVQMVDFESRINGSVESHAHGENSHCQVRVAACVGRKYERYRRTKLTCEHSGNRKR